MKQPSPTFAGVPYCLPCFLTPNSVYCANVLLHLVNPKAVKWYQMNPAAKRHVAMLGRNLWIHTSISSVVKQLSTLSTLHHSQQGHLSSIISWRQHETTLSEYNQAMQSLVTTTSRFVICFRISSVFSSYSAFVCVCLPYLWMPPKSCQPPGCTEKGYFTSSANHTITMVSSGVSIPIECHFNICTSNFSVK